MTRRANTYIVCVKNQDYPASLEFGKIYRTLPDDGATKHRLLRVMDESDEDYFYPDAFFLPIELTAEIEKVLSF